MLRRQGGVALVLAMLVVTLSVVLVMPLFARQEYLTRYTTMQRDQAAARAAQRSALAWVAGVLEDDARRSNVDHLGEAWRMDDVALPVPGLATPAGSGAAPASLSVSVADAQARYNLANLSQNGVVDEVEVATLEKLLAMLHADPGAAATIARRLSASQVPARMPGTTQVAAASSAVPLTVVDDILPALAADVRDHLALLPEATPLNVNTSDAALLAARFPAMSLEQARQIVQLRGSAYFRDLADFIARTHGLGVSETLVNVSVASDYFLVRLALRVDGGVSLRDALMWRSGGHTSLVSMHEPTQPE